MFEDFAKESGALSEGEIFAIFNYEGAS